MSQPQLGKKINETRNKKGITQKNLSEKCNIDIRTIQRIESGEVLPRTSTLKLIAEALDTDLHELNEEDQYEPVKQKGNSDLVFVTMVIGIVHFINWFFYAPLFPMYKMYNPYNWIHSTINIMTDVFFYLGFYIIAKHHTNKLLKFASLFFIILSPVYFIISVVNDDVSRLVVSILGFNCIFFGFGLLKIRNFLPALYKSTGILQLLIAPFFILPIGVLTIIGVWMNIPLYILLLCIMFLEYKKLKQIH
jgi:transcriptional regulator with XRE-family HTH domain